MCFIVIIYTVECNINNSDCVRYYFKKYKRKRLRKHLLYGFFIFFFFLFLVLTYFIKVVNPIIFSYAISEVESLIANSCNKAISQLDTINYDNLIQISYDSNKKINSIVANSQKINYLANSLSNKTSQNLAHQSLLGIKIPIGTCSGISFLAGKGNNIAFKINPIGNVLCYFSTSFTHAGINQTSHKIFVIISCEASVILPFNIKKIKKEVEFLVSECLIIGEVPNMYVNITDIKDLYKK